ncbi:MAG TPA: alpha/beta hydrolase-fold protein [Bryobacteraceae bacterium]
MRISLGLLALAAAWAYQAAKPAPRAIIQDLTHFSQVMGENRAYRIFLPPAYASSQRRYPVIYWFHGYGERFNNSANGRNYDDGGYNGDTIANYVATHEVIVVKWDGWNPRTPNEQYVRPYNVGPVETSRQFALYFPELVEHIDKTLRTLADRDHRAATGYSMGSFMSYWVAGKYPDLVGSASAFMPSPEFVAGPQGFDAEYSLEDTFANFAGVRTRLVTGSRDFIQFYHRRLNAIWMFAKPDHETENFDSDHGTPGIAKTFDFHLRAFASPLPKPEVFSHADIYPNFTVWNWEVVSDRKQPGFTVLDEVSRTGFRSAVRQWIPDGAAIPEVKLSIVSARLYPAGSTQSVTYIRLRDGKVRRAQQKADAQGRLTFDLDGAAYEIGVSVEPLLAISGYEVEGAPWASAGKPVTIRVKFWNKGGARMPTALLKWENPNPGVKLASPTGRLYGLNPGESAMIPVTFTAEDPARAVVRLYAVDGARRIPLTVPLFPPAEPAREFTIVDGGDAIAFQHAVEKATVTLGEGNRDGHAAPGETFAVLLPDGGALRAAELFTNDACVDNSVRASDYWGAYDSVGASAKYSLPTIRPECPPGHIVHMLARILIPNKPNHEVRYATLEFPVWYRNQ